jgi:hypothetical protein
VNSDSSYEYQGLTDAELRLPRTCAICRQSYVLAEKLTSQSFYLGPPHNYLDACTTHCLACWLGVGPIDRVERSEPEDMDDHDGELLRDLGPWLRPGVQLAVMPIARISLESPARFEEIMIFYPRSVARLEDLHVLQNDPASKRHAELASTLAGVTLETFDDQATVAFPVELDWNGFLRMSHRDHLDLIRSLSEAVDNVCLNMLRYRLCRMEPIDALPARAGQIMSNPMMASAPVYNPAQLEGRIIAGDAFTHMITRGLGLPIYSLDEQEFLRHGEVGNLVNHALSLYTAVLEADTPTAKFVQAMSLLDFLADPYEYRPFKELKRVVARYIASNSGQYRQLLDRFRELTGNKDPNTGRETGYRTRIVHLGDRLDKILPSPAARRALFEELDGYIRPIIDHMIQHSDLTFAAYNAVRDGMRGFEP